MPCAWMGEGAALWISGGVEFREYPRGMEPEWGRVRSMPRVQYFWKEYGLA